MCSAKSSGPNKSWMYITGSVWPCVKRVCSERILKDYVVQLDCEYYFRVNYELVISDQSDLIKNVTKQVSWSYKFYYL